MQASPSGVNYPLQRQRPVRFRVRHRRCHSLLLALLWLLSDSSSRSPDFVITASPVSTPFWLPRAKTTLVTPGHFLPFSLDFLCCKYSFHSYPDDSRYWFTSLRHPLVLLLLLDPATAATETSSMATISQGPPLVQGPRDGPSILHGIPPGTIVFGLEGNYTLTICPVQHAV